MSINQVAIIGAGPAGLACAIQLKRHEIQPLLLESHAAGGLLRNANLVENYPGFPNGITGMELVILFTEQAERHAVQVTFARVDLLTYQEGVFELRVGEDMLNAKIVVVASGTKPVTLDGINLPESLQDKILYEVHPLLAIRDKTIAIIGAGDAAFDYALNLARQNNVIIINRDAQTHCLPLLQERALTSTRISYHENTVIINIAEGMAGKLLLDCSSPQGLRQLGVDYLIAAIGRCPQLDFISPPFMEQMPELIKRGMLYIIGDVKNDRYRQTSIATGEGVLAAMKIHRHLKEHAQ